MINWFLNITFLFIFSHSLFGFVNEQNPHIIEIETLNQISQEQPEGTVYFFDIDDTLIDSPYILGSKAWRKYIAAATKENKEQNWHDFFTLYLALHHPYVPVEDITANYINKLKQQGFSVFGLTARERNVWYDTPTPGVDKLTVKQLQTIGIFLSPTSYSNLVSAQEYYEGIFFADSDNKGDYLIKLFKDAGQLPSRVIFIDDKLSQVESVSTALTQLGIPNECYWYKAVEKKPRKFDPLVANLQLYYFWMWSGSRVLTDDEARAKTQDYPEIRADDYLRMTIEDARNYLILRATTS